MLELLEELPAPFKKAFNKVVKDTELTMISVMINENEGLVLTNRKLYHIIRKFLFGTKVDVITLNDITSVTCNGDLILEFENKIDKTLGFKKEKRYLCGQVAEKISQEIIARN